MIKIVLPIEQLAQEPDSTLGEASSDWAPPDLQTWLDSAQGEPEYVLENLLPADSKIIFSGKPKRAFKSWMAYAIALSVASGKALGPLVPVNKLGARVLVLAAEGGKTKNRNRFLWLGKGLGIDIAALQAKGMFKFSFKEPILLKNPEWVYKIARYVRKNDIRLLIIDPLIMFSGVDENKSDQLAIIMHAINEIGKNGCAVIFVHHLTKSMYSSKSGSETARDIDEEIRGSSALAGFYDSHWAFRKKHDDQKHNDLTIRSKDDEELNFEVRWSIDKVEETAVFRMEPLTEEVAAKRRIDDIYAELIPTQEYTLKAIARIADADTTETTALIKQMIESGMLEVQGRNYVCKQVG